MEVVVAAAGGLAATFNFTHTLKLSPLSQKKFLPTRPRAPKILHSV